MDRNKITPIFSAGPNTKLHQNSLISFWE